MMNNHFRILFFLISFFCCSQSKAFGPFAFIRQQPDSIVFSTTAQTINAKACSGIVTVQNRNSSNIAKNVAADLTVNLGAVAGVTYFSDSTCTVPITNITITTGNSLSSFYFLSSTTGTKSLIATATNYPDITQNETLNTNPFVWTGTGGNTNWNTATNWSGNVVPSSVQMAVFDGSCSSCLADVNVTTAVGGIRIESSFTGTITHSAALTLNSDFVQLAGTFTGGSLAITINGKYILNGGTFTSTTGILRLNSNLVSVLNTPTFNHNNGIVVFNLSSGPVINGVANINFYDVQFYGNGSSAVGLLNSTMNVLGSFTLKDFGYASALAGNASINVSAHLNIEGSGWNVSTGVLIKMIGTGTITGSGTGSRLGSLEINTAGTTTFATTGSIDITGDFTYTAGSVVTTNSLVRFTGLTQTISSGSMNFNNVSFYSLNNGTISETINGVMNVAGNLVWNCASYSSRIYSGTINVSGNFSTQGSQVLGGSALIKMVGTGTITGSTVAGSYITSLEIDTAGTITFASTDSINIAGNFKYTSGTVITTGSTIKIAGITAVTVDAGTVVFNNLSFVQSATSPNTIIGTIKVNGDLVFQALSFWPSVNGGSIEVLGNLSTIGNWGGGTTSLILNGTSIQTMTRTGAFAYFPGTTITVNNASSLLTLATNVTLNTGQGIAVTAGNINMAGFALSTKTLTLNSNTLTKNGGVLTVNAVVAGTGPLFGGTVAP